MIRHIIAFLMALALSGCGALNIKRPVAEDDLKTTKRVGVIAILGDTFNGVSIGTTVFNNTYFSGTVSDWNVDASASNAALDLLRKNANFKSTLVDRAGLTTEQARADGGKLLWQAAEQQGFDRLVILRPGVSDNYPFFRPSYGFFERSFFGSSRRCVYAAYVVDVYDVASRKPIAWEWGGGGPCELGKDSDLAFKTQYSDYTDAEKASFRKRLEARIAESLRYSLEKLSLLPTGAAAK